MKFKFAEEFSSYPYGRYKADGKFSGEALREILMVKFLEAESKKEPLEIVLDDVHGLSGSFLDESFGGLAKQLKDQGKRLSEDNMRFTAKPRYYKAYISKIWDNIRKHYEVENEVHTA